MKRRSEKEVSSKPRIMKLREASQRVPPTKLRRPPSPMPSQLDLSPNLRKTERTMAILGALKRPRSKRLASIKTPPTKKSKPATEAAPPPATVKAPPPASTPAPPPASTPAPPPALKRTPPPSALKRRPPPVASVAPPPVLAHRSPRGLSKSVGRRAPPASAKKLAAPPAPAKEVVAPPVAPAKKVTAPVAPVKVTTPAAPPAKNVTTPRGLSKSSVSRQAPPPTTNTSPALTPPASSTADPDSLMPDIEPQADHDASQDDEGKLNPLDYLSIRCKNSLHESTSNLLFG